MILPQFPECCSYRLSALPLAPTNMFLEYLCFMCADAGGSVCGYEHWRAGANGDQKRTSGPPGAGVTGGCELLDMGSRDSNS